MNDKIYRKDALSALKDTLVDEEWVYAKRVIETLPSAQSDALETNVGDMISRQAAIGSIMGEPSEVRYPAFYAEKIKQLPSAQSGRKAPVSYKEQLSLDCSFCRQHERGDMLYESSDWDGGIGFDYIRNIRFCPICGRELYGEE